jgi:hypothetical protein
VIRAIDGSAGAYAGRRRFPAGIFRLSSITGYAPTPPVGAKLPYERADDQLRCVDDATSSD